MPGKAARGDAEGLYQRALAIREKALGRDHPDVARTLDNLAILSGTAGNRESALAYSRRATAAVIAHAAIETPGAQQKEQRGGLVEQRAHYFLLHVANLAAARGGVEPAPALGREAFEIAQWGGRSFAAAALQGEFVTQPITQRSAGHKMLKFVNNLPLYAMCCYIT